MKTIDIIKTLRTETKMPLKLCKKFAEVSDGDLNQARVSIKHCMKSPNMKVLDNEATENLIVSKTINGNVGVLAEFRTQTDFVAKSPEMREFTNKILNHLLSTEHDSIEAILNELHVEDRNYEVRQMFNEMMHVFGEKIYLNRFVKYVN